MENFRSGLGQHIKDRLNRRLRLEHKHNSFAGEVRLREPDLRKSLSELVANQKAPDSDFSHDRISPVRQTPLVVRLCPPRIPRNWSEPMVLKRAFACALQSASDWRKRMVACRSEWYRLPGLNGGPPDPQSGALTN